MENGESVWGVAWCRGYLSTVSTVSTLLLIVCGDVNGAHAIYSDCDVRYEKNNFFAEANNRVTIQHHLSHKSSEKVIIGPSNCCTKITQALSTRQVADGSATVYAIAQCNLNISQSRCLECLQMRSSSLYDGRAMLHEFA